MKYIVEFGRAATGLVPVMDTFVRLDTMTPLPLPPIVEIPGTGAYYFDYVFADGSTHDVYFSVDSRSPDLGGVGEDSRYRSGVLSPSDTFLDKKVSAVGQQDQTAVLVAIAAARDSIKGANSRDLSQVALKTDALPNDPASQVSVNTKVDQAVTAVQGSITNARSTIMGAPGQNIQSVYDKVANIPVDIASQATTNASIAAARAELDGRIDAAKAEIETNLGAAVESSRVSIEGQVTDARDSIKGSGNKTLTDIDDRTKNLPADPASQAAVIAEVTDARDSVNGTVMTSTGLIRGADGRTATEVYEKVKNLPNTALAEQASVAAIPDQVRDILGGVGFDGTTDSLHQLRAQQDTQAATLASHSGLLARILGMLHENSVLDQTIYDSENNLTAGRLRIYDSAENATAAHAAGEGDDATPGKIAEYAISGAYIGGLLESYAVTRILPA